MRNILFVGPDLHEVGGVSTYCKAILESYPGKIEYFPFPLGMKKNPFTFLAVLWKFVGKISNNPGAVVHINTSFNISAVSRDAVFLLLALLFSRKTVVFVHGWRSSFEESLTGWRLALFRALFNRASVIFVLADVFRAALIARGFTTRIVVETTCFPPDLYKMRSSTTAAQNLSNRGPRILFLSRIVREKGAFELLDACLRLVDSFPALKLDIAGDGPELQALKDYAALVHADFVTFHGAVTGNAKCALLEETTVYCLPSYTEGLPVTILEAMFFGLPVITTRVGGIADVFVNGKNGLFVEPKDAADLEAKLRVLLSDFHEQEHMSRNNAAYALSRFAPNAVAHRLAEEHEKLGN